MGPEPACNTRRGTTWPAVYVDGRCIPPPRAAGNYAPGSARGSLRAPMGMAGGRRAPYRRQLAGRNDCAHRPRRQCGLDWLQIEHEHLSPLPQCQRHCRLIDELERVARIQALTIDGERAAGEVNIGSAPER